MQWEIGEGGHFPEKSIIGEYGSTLLALRRSGDVKFPEKSVT